MGSHEAAPQNTFLQHVLPSWMLPDHASFCCFASCILQGGSSEGLDDLEELPHIEVSPFLM